MKKVISFILQAFGILFICLIFYISFQLMAPVKEKKNFSKSDIKFVLNWGGLNPNQNFEIIKAHKYAYRMMDDYEEIYCLQLKDGNIGRNSSTNWVHGASTEPTIIRIRQETARMADLGTCLNGIHDGNSEKISAYIFRARIISGGKIDGAEVLYLNPRTNRLLFIGHQL